MRDSVRKALIGFALFEFLAHGAYAANVSALYARGYTALPQPQQVTLDDSDFAFGPGWRLELEPGVAANDVAVETLREELTSRFGICLTAEGSKTIELVAAPGSVAAGSATDRDRQAILSQAYRLELKPRQVNITANAACGLFYGVATLLQLVRPRQGKFWLPSGTITDWPDLELRIIYWDDAHHLERPAALKAALRQAALYKINGFALKLEGHFLYRHSPAITEPYALTPDELQELTDYGLQYHIQLIPYLDAPAHDAFILKHPQYEHLREFPGSDYEFCATNPATTQLFQGMYDDLLAANKGSRYFVLSTDEPYYVGMAANSQCNELDRARQLGSRGKLLAEFVTRLASYLHERGRTVIFWGEYPLKPSDIASLPGDLLNGETYGPDYDPVFKAHGIRQLVYTSTVGYKEFLFPNYYLLPTSKLLAGQPGSRHSAAGQEAGNVEKMDESISNTPARKQADLMGTFVAGWADTGIHPETMWLGYVTGSAAGWNPTTPSPQEQMASFYHLFYGPSSVEMGRLYQLMSEQAQFWNESWDVVASNARTPIFGNSYEIFHPPHPAEDQAIPQLSVPAPGTLAIPDDWSRQNARRLRLASHFLEQNDQLLDLLYLNLQRADFNRYNLEVFLSIAQLCRQNLKMLLDLSGINDSLKAAQTATAEGQAAGAVADLDRGLDIARLIWLERNRDLRSAAETWYKSWYPRVAEANGRRYFDRVDDVKDHLPVRTVDMSYLIYRELLYPMGTWAEKTLAVRNGYAVAHGLPSRTANFDWGRTLR